MEGLMKIVAASFLRHGLEGPGAEVAGKEPAAHSARKDASVSEPTLPALPEHNYRKQSEAERAL